MAEENKNLSEEENFRNEFSDILRMIPGLEGKSNEDLRQLWGKAVQEYEMKQQEKKKRRRKILGTIFLLIGIVTCISGFFFSKWLIIIGSCIIVIKILAPSK